MIAASILLGRCLAPVEQLIGAWRNFVQARLTWKNLRNCVAELDEKPAMSLPAPKGDVCVENLVFTRRGYPAPVVNDVNFELNAGTILLLMGPSGSGKSTICRLLVGAARPDSGDVRLDGRTIHGWNREELGKNIGYLPQDASLLPGTIGDNIARFTEGAAEAVTEAAKLAGADEMIRGLPDEYDTMITSDSTFPMSGGQRQRIGLARALYKMPRLIVLDEPNPNLDAEGEHALLKAVSAARAAGSTIIVVSHRPSMLKVADLVGTLEAGELTYLGGRSDILAHMTKRATSPDPKQDQVVFRTSNGPGRAAANSAKGAVMSADSIPDNASSAALRLRSWTSSQGRYGMSDERQKRETVLRQSLRGPARMSALAALVFFGGFGGWATTVPIASASMAPGSISPEGYRRTVQHLEGGIIREILVSEGQQVQVGQPLIILENSETLALNRTQNARLITLKATETRLLAELSDHAPDWAAVPQGDQREQAIADQQAIFVAQKQAYDKRAELLQQAMDHNAARRAGLHEQVDLLQRQITLLEERLTAVTRMVEKKIKPKTELEQLEIQHLQSVANLSSYRAQIEQLSLETQELAGKMDQLRIDQRDAASKRLGEIRGTVAELQERMTASRNILDRTMIQAPIDGTVIDLAVTTAGGVIRAGEDIMDIVPDSEELIIDARVMIGDIDVVQAGLEATMVLSAFQQRNMPKMTGAAGTISADRLTDEKTGEQHYLARIETSPEAREVLGDAYELTAGMPANTMIYTGSRTMFDYLIGPLLVSVNTSFRED